MGRIPNASLRVEFRLPHVSVGQFSLHLSIVLLTSTVEIDEQERVLRNETELQTFCCTTPPYIISRFRARGLDCDTHSKIAHKEIISGKIRDHIAVAGNNRVN